MSDEEFQRLNNELNNGTISDRDRVRFTNEAVRRANQKRFDDLVERARAGDDAARQELEDWINQGNLAGARAGGGLPLPGFGGQPDPFGGPEGGGILAQLDNSFNFETGQGGGSGDTFLDKLLDPEVLVSLGLGLFNLISDREAQGDTAENIDRRVSQARGVLSPFSIAGRTSVLANVLRNLVLPGANVAGEQAAGDLAARLGRSGTSFTGQGEILRGISRAAPRIAAEQTAVSGAADLAGRTSIAEASALAGIPIPQGTSTDLSGLFEILQAAELTPRGAQ